MTFANVEISHSLSCISDSTSSFSLSQPELTTFRHTNYNRTPGINGENEDDVESPRRRPVSFSQPTPACLRGTLDMQATQQSQMSQLGWGMLEYGDTLVGHLLYLFVESVSRTR